MDRQLYTSLPEELYDAASVRELDRRAIEIHGLSSDVLMERAGVAALELLRTRWPRVRRPVVVCGSGNNGGDGYVLARHAHIAELDVRVLTLGAQARDRAAVRARAACVEAGVAISPFDHEALPRADAIVDAILGIGLARDVDGPMRAAMEAINAQSKPVLALDVPSGLSADTGAIMGTAVRADATIAFIGLKAGLYTGAGRTCAGEIYLADLGVPAEVYRGSVPRAWRLSPRVLAGLLKPRPADANKGNFGRVLIVGGDVGMAGAARLAGEAAYRAGAGLVTVATHPVHASALSAARPELLVNGVNGGGVELRALLARADVVAVGPGLGKSEWSQSLLAAVLDHHAKSVVDADALNLIARDPATRPDWVLTPHPGEAARLLQTTSTDIQRDRFKALEELHARFGGVVVLKGSGTLIKGGDGATYLCDRGSPAMATGGTGDVLTGAIAGLIAQGLAPFDAARLGVFVHSAAGDAVATDGSGLFASDLLEPMRAQLHALRDAD